MKRKYQSSIQRANEVIRGNRKTRQLTGRIDKPAKPDAKLETLNCANAFAKNGKSLEHLFDKLF